MPSYRLTTGDGAVLQEWDAADATAAESEAVDVVSRHRADDPPGAAEYVLLDEAGGDVARWGPVAP
ncbi:hypothetical protein GCM10027451_37720 [Geodermatophilus aquaeductus]|jgi:hypothetical protein|uniref:YD repeat-containing protein n=1 Tax=Geodermatophilus aquaeductus TaxID=1564161 RepID=A0A521FHC4_9ACTN|nr:hypothetical protein [Geodermatophilus aquaeductus]SMO95607.1 hypothetical protein SAMN06273567_10928 [Geodermatophilus aquaeductus]